MGETMRFMIGRCFSGLTSLALMTAVLTAMEPGPQPPRLKGSDESLRKWAKTSPAPVYPRTSLARKAAGVAVATIVTDAQGRTSAVEILQSPDAETGRAVHDALGQWTFPVDMLIVGRLVFYFHLKGPTGVVLSPAEMREVTNAGVPKVDRAAEPPLRSITEPAFRALATRTAPVTLDTRDRETFAEGHEKGATNIPFDEMLPRVAAELPASRPVVIDCREPPDYCALAAHWLSSSGFKQVFVLSR